MENTNSNRNQPYRQDWNDNDQDYDRNRENQGKSQRYNNDYRGDDNFRSREWQNNQRGNYNDQYLSGNYGRSNYNDQSRGDNNKDYQNRGGNNWNQGYENRNSNRNWGQGNYGSDSRNNDRDRNWWDRTSDEVASWFGDDEAERRRRMDKINGPHRGKGPKGYTRSDDRITEDVNEKLYHDPHIDASNIEVQVSNGDVTLSGSVDSRYSKRHAEDLAESVAGVKDVTNQIKVSNTNQYDTSNSQASEQYTNEQYNGRKKSSWLS